MNLLRADMRGSYIKSKSHSLLVYVNHRVMCKVYLDFKTDSFAIVPQGHTKGIATINFTLNKTKETSLHSFQAVYVDLIKRRPQKHF